MRLHKGETIKLYCDKQKEVFLEAFLDIKQVLADVVDVKVESYNDFNVLNIKEAEKGICFGNISEDKKMEMLFPDVKQKLENSDGFLIRKIENVIFVLSLCDEGVYYGAHDLLEENLDVVFSRGAQDYDYDYIKQDEVVFYKCDYIKVSPFIDRAINMCGIGTEGKDHRDYGSARYYARNKVNHIDVYDENWIKFGYQFNYTKFSAVNIDNLIEEHPEYFMTDPFGNPKNSKYESYINYTNKEAAKAVAERYIEIIKDKPEKCYVWSTMPDDPTFYAKHNGVEVTSLPYTAENGVTVYPQQKNYKSTIYFDFYNAVVKEVAKVYPNVQIVTLAYLYAEHAPEVEIDEHLIVALAPIKANDKYSFIAQGQTGNKEAKENIEKWASKCKTLSIYTYWFSFHGHIYSRPILKAVKENLLWFKELGIKRLLLENHLECTLKEGLTEKQLESRRYFDMNEPYIWAVNKLIFEPELDIDELLKHYCKVVYKESAKQMYDYFKAIEEGYEKTDAYVWYAVGGDIYTHLMIIKAGVADKVISALEEALKQATTPKVKSRVESVYKIVKGEIDKYSSFVDEEGIITYCDEGKSVILDENQALYRDNPKSIWNSTKPMTVLRNYDTLAFYNPEAKFECRMLYDNENLYVAFSVYDDLIEKADVGADGQLTIVRSNGKPVVSYSETYIGGNVLNQSEYYGVISGFDAQKGLMQIYLNNGTPIEQSIPDGAEDVKFVRLSEDPKQRYYVHVQVIPLSVLGTRIEDFSPYGSFVYYTNRYARAGWKGVGLWSKNNFSKFKLEKMYKEGNRNG